MTKAKNKTSPYKTVRVDQSLKPEIDYWQKKCGYKTTKDFIDAAVKHFIAYKNGDYQLPNAETQRLNQIITAITALTKQNEVLTNTINNAFSTLLRLSDDDNEES